MEQTNVSAKKRLLSIAFIGALVSASFSATNPLLIDFNFDNTTPSTVLNQLSYYESLPFDGNTLRIDASWSILTSNNVSYASIYSALSPLIGKYSKLNHCWIFIGLNNPGDWFDNTAWNACIQNFATAAQVCKDIGLEGVFLDPEGVYPTWNYSQQPQASSRSEDQYRAQARLRGKALMEACGAIYPAFKIVTAHGPYISEPNTPLSVRREQYGNNPPDSRLLGPFFVGLTQGVGSQGMVIDGGEIYQYRSLQDFQGSYTWRKTTIASSANNSPNIPAADRAGWPDKVSISFGLYPLSWPNASADLMTPDIMRTTAENALRTCDYMVWWYDAFNAEFVAALQGACDAVKSGSSTDKKAPTVPTSLTTSNIGEKSFTLSWTASTDSAGVTGYQVFKGGVSVGTSTVTTLNVTGLLCASDYAMTVKARDAAGNWSAASVPLTVTTSACIPIVRTPYNGIAGSIPGTIQAEDYDLGGEGVAYHDLAAGNELGAYRTDDVDVETTSDLQGGGYQLGHTGTGEWLEYTVNVAATGTYALDTRVASATAMQFHLFVDGTDVTNAVDAPASGGWTNWTTVSKSGIALTAGQHVVRFSFTSAGFCLNWIRFSTATHARPSLIGMAMPGVKSAATTFTMDGKLLTPAAPGRKPQQRPAIRQTIVNGRLVTEKTIVVR